MTPPRSDHFNGKTFFQAHNERSGRLRDLLRWRFTKKSIPWPEKIIIPPQPPPPHPSGDDVVVTWIGHASFLLQSATLNVLIDPVFSDRVSPVSWIGPRRAHPPGTPFDSLPEIDAVLLSHDHYDHFDLPTLRGLTTKHDPLFIAPLRHSDLLASAGTKKFVELDWWQTHRMAGTSSAAITLTPTKHWSNRFGSPRNHRLWGGFWVELGPRRLWFLGDSGYDEEIFRSIRTRLGSPDLALIPIGAYEPRWFMEPMHMNPAEAVQAHRDVGSRHSIGMHWGTFQLTDEGRDDPVTALADARKAVGVAPEEFRVLHPGESIVT
jgi:L-ascorbate metabolism protein UlaG (beta-lactamase superfamily)